ncbi:hypothetical protein AAC387_Pa09g1920 [Persea americana]
MCSISISAPPPSASCVQSPSPSHPLCFLRELPPLPLASMAPLERERLMRSRGEGVLQVWQRDEARMEMINDGVSSAQVEGERGDEGWGLLGCFEGVRRWRREDDRGRELWEDGEEREGLLRLGEDERVEMGLGWLFCAREEDREGW